MRSAPPQIVLCNGADLPKQWANSKPIILEFRESTGIDPNVRLELPNFVLDVFNLSDRTLDLLELAVYVYCADRLVSRGLKDNVEYHSWSRLFHFVIRVRDFEFWTTSDAKEKLKEALTFMSGDRAFHFTFQEGHSTPSAGLFDKKTFRIEPRDDAKVILFSGGLDSLGGIVERLEHSSDELYLISHRSGQPSTAKTQDRLIARLLERYPNRIRYYQFKCGLNKTRAREETQRTRAFLYTAIAYALSHALFQKRIFVYENGITSINFAKGQDQINARASRTTHPKTIALLENLFSVINESKINIVTPFLWKTKTDIFHVAATAGHRDLLTSTVSCSQTRQHPGEATHCGGCSQCIDRRFAAYGSKLDDVDEGGIYALDFIKGNIVETEVKTTLIDYVVQAGKFASLNVADFYYQMFSELANLIDHVPGVSEQEKIEKIWKLCHRHGKQVEAASRRMREIHDDNLYRQLPEDSFLQMIAKREYLMSAKPQLNGIEVFYSYSHKDEELREQLENHLSTLRRQRAIKDWHYRKITGGREWEGEIDEHLRTAHVILLLISSDFIASDYCYDVEMKLAMELYNVADARVIPIILRPVDWKGTPFGKLQALPKNALPVTKWNDPDDAFTDIAKGIRTVVEELNQT